MNGRIVEHEIARGVSVYMMAYLIIFAASVLVVSFDNFGFTTNFTGVLATINNIGPGLDGVGPTRNFGMYSNLSKVVFDEDLCLAFCKGYMREAGAFLTDADREYLYDSIRLLPFELGLRFFQDYLNGNVYFKTKTPEQNLNRARVQFRLCESIEARERSIRNVLKRL